LAALLGAAAWEPRGFVFESFGSATENGDGVVEMGKVVVPAADADPPLRLWPLPLFAPVC
jgi:hypothetical protein